MIWRFRRPQVQVVQEIDYGGEHISHVVRIPISIPDDAELDDGQLIINGSFDLEIEEAPEK